MRRWYVVRDAPVDVVSQAVVPLVVVETGRHGNLGGPVVGCIQKRGVIGLEWEIPLKLLLCMTTRAKVAGAGAINKDPT